MPRQFLCASRHFETKFEALPEVQIEPKCACWKALPVYFPTQVEFLNLGVHLPLQNLNLPRLLPVCEIRGKEVIFGVFLTS